MRRLYSFVSMRVLVIYSTVSTQMSRCYFYTNQLLSSPSFKKHFISLVDDVACADGRRDATARHTAAAILIRVLITMGEGF